jgi:DNA mismatch repair protein MutL
VRLIVNGRPLIDKRLPYVAREAFAGILEIGRFPFVWLSLEVDPKLVDVNIHPQKKEVRWASGFQPSSLIFSPLRSALLNLSSSRAGISEPIFSQESFSLSQNPSTIHAQTSVTSFPQSPTSATSIPVVETFQSPQQRLSSGTFSNKDTPVFLSPVPPFRFSDLRVVGEVGASWIVCESPEGLVVIDQHAAHERVEFHKQLQKVGTFPVKPLLLPFRIRVPLGAQDSVERLQSFLESLGFEFADLSETPSQSELEIVAVPQPPRTVDWESFLETVFSDLSQGFDPETHGARLKVKMAASMACHGSVRRGQRLDPQSIRALLQDLDSVDWGGLCAHGRPLWQIISHAQLESLFHRS